MGFLTTTIGKLLKVFILRSSKKRFPVINGEFKLQGINEEVEIIRDNIGVPHIFAKNEQDLFYAMGFVHAQDRLWQMELNRRTARGQLSEIFGEVALDTDRAVRTFGFERIGLKDWENAPDEVKKMIYSYIAGINAFIEHPETKFPIEFSLIKHKPRKWVKEDVLALSRFMAWSLSHSWYAELIWAEVIEKVGEKLAKYLDIRYPDENAVILPKGIEFREFNSKGVLEKTKGPFLSRNLGSNSLVVSGKYTKSGKPLVAHDVHLALSTPEVWYETHQSCPSFNTYGVSIPGLPLVLIGQNDYFVWCMTLAYTDAADIYVEKLDPKELTYEFMGEKKKVQVIEEVIKVKGKKEHVEKILFTHHGPIISDVVEELPGKYLSVADKALEPANLLYSWYLLNHGKNWNDFVKAIKEMRAPQLNVSYADIYGNIGYWVSGAVPIRKKGNGRLPVPGWSGEYEWNGEIPFEEMPHALNPEQGFIVTANNKIVPDDFPHYLGSVWMNGYRAERITQLVKEKIVKGEKLDLEDGNKIMGDVYSIPGVKFVKHIIELETDNSLVLEVQEILGSWNGYMDPELVGPTLYQVIRYYLTRSIFEEKLGEKLTNKIMGDGYHPILLAANEFQGHDIDIILNLLENPENPWIGGAEKKEELLINSIYKASEWLKKKLGKNMDNWLYGKIHKAVYEHAFTLNPPMDIVFNPDPVPIKGGNDTPFQTSYSPSDPFHNKLWSPSFRIVADLADLKKTKSTTALGQVGHLGHPHYDDKRIIWANGRYHPSLLLQEALEKNIEGKLSLKPNSS